ncbi:MAG: hypothetical protein LWW86_10690 [Micrococcales bacterium]|nr:hypothetical protein [Micrococcales bacterium]
MAFWKRRRADSAGSGRSRSDGPAMSVDMAAARTHLREFATSRRGVEAYVEPSTNVTPTTVVLIAHDGEWTRRAMASRRDAFDLAAKLGVPVYDVNQTGYPGRMREWSARQRRAQGGR